MTANCTCGAQIKGISTTATRTCASCKRVWDYPRLLQLIAATRAGFQR